MHLSDGTGRDWCAQVFYKEQLSKKNAERFGAVAATIRFHARSSLLWSVCIRLHTSDG